MVAIRILTWSCITLKTFQIAGTLLQSICPDPEKLINQLNFSIHRVSVYSLDNELHLRPGFRNRLS